MLSKRLLYDLNAHGENCSRLIVLLECAENGPIDENGLCLKMKHNVCDMFSKRVMRVRALPRRDVVKKILGEFSKKGLVEPFFVDDRRLLRMSTAKHDMAALARSIVEEIKKEKKRKGGKK